MEGLADAASFVRWWDEHSELDELILEVEQAIGQKGAARAGAALERFCEAMEMHFAVEETVSFPLVERASPRHRAVLAAARLAHQKIRESLEDLRELVELARFAAAQRALAVLLDRFCAHEAAEESLIRELEGS